MPLSRLQCISLYHMPWRSQTNAIFAKSQNCSWNTDAKITKLSNIQNVTPILLVTSCNTMDCYCETSYDNNKDKKIEEICPCKDCNIFLCRPCHGVHKQVRSLLYHRILRGSTMPQTNLSNIQTVIISSILVVNSSLFGYCETCYDNKDKKIDETCFWKDCNIFLCTPCHDVHKQMPSLLKHRILLRESTDKAIKYYYLHIACH